MSGERGGKLADWANRNPNGLQPISAFAEDYRAVGHLHYNVPPVRLGIEGGESDHAPEPNWHGYTGAKSFFTQQPMPGQTQLLLTGGYAPNQSEVSRVINEQPNSLPQVSPGVPCTNMTMASKSDKDAMVKISCPEQHPIHVCGEDPKLWRFDGRDHTFQEPKK